MAQIDNVIGLLRNVDDATNFQFPSANIEQVDQITANTATTTILCNQANVFNITLAANTTLAFDYSGITLTTDDAYTMTLIVSQDAATQYTLTFPAASKFQSGVAPTVPAIGQTDIFVCFTADGGANWHVFLAGEDMS